MILLLNFLKKTVLRPIYFAKSCPFMTSFNVLTLPALTKHLSLYLVLVLPTLSASSFAEGQSRPAGHSDRLFLDNQQELAETIVYDALLTRLTGQKDHDIALLQQVIDKQSLARTQTKELQALGVALGNLMAKEYRLPWVIYIDDKGRSRGLEIDNTTQVLFPLTMISRRVEADAKTDVAAIYKKAEEIISYTRANRLLFTK